MRQKLRGLTRISPLSAVPLHLPLLTAAAAAVSETDLLSPAAHPFLLLQANVAVK
jgi:hypothetical protein